MRDCFSKYLRAEKTGSGQAAKCISRYKIWPWAQQMETLWTYLEFTKTHSNIPNAIAGSPEEIAQATEEYSEATETLDSLQSEENNNQGRSSYFERKEKRKRKLIEDCPSNSSFVETVIKFLNKKPNEVHNDAIDFVFQGYGASVKKLSPRRQTLVKYQVAKIITEAELAQLADTQGLNQPITSPPLNSTSPSYTSNMIPCIISMNIAITMGLLMMVQLQQPGMKISLIMAYKFVL